MPESKIGGVGLLCRDCLGQLQTERDQIQHKYDVVAATLQEVARAFGLSQDCTRKDLIREAHTLKNQSATKGRPQAPSVEDINRALLEGSLLLAPSGMPVLGPPATPRQRVRAARAPQPAARQVPVRQPVTRYRVGHQMRVLRYTAEPSLNGKIGTLYCIDRSLGDALYLVEFDLTVPQNHLPSSTYHRDYKPGQPYQANGWRWLYRNQLERVSMS